MKTREYEFSGHARRWREWREHPPTVIHEELWGDSWRHASGIPPTPAAAQALAALIEDMQVQVIAEWECSGWSYRARESETGTIVEQRQGDYWAALGPNALSAASFVTGYEAGKAAR